MIKFLFKFIVILIVLAVAALGGVYYYAGTIIKTAVEKFGPQITQTDVKLNDVDISLLKGHISLNGLSVANPKGYGAEKAFGIGKLVVTFDPQSVLTDKIVINQVLIDGLQASAEVDYKNDKISSNLTDIKANVENYLDSVAGAPKEEAKEETKETVKEEKAENTQTETAPEKKLVIRDFQINNSELTLGVLAKTLTLPLPNIHQTNIGEDTPKKSWKETISSLFDSVMNGTEMKKFIENVIGEVMKAVLNIDELAATAAQGAKEAAQGALDSAGSLADSAKEAAGSVLDSAGKLGDSVKGLFGK